MPLLDALDEKLAVDPQMLEHLQATFRSRGNPMPEGNIKQATRTPSTDPISNPMGTAPGWWSEKDKTIIVAMPGVPSELKRMWEQEVEPILKKRHNSTVILSRTLKTFGYAESAISDQLNSKQHTEQVKKDSCDWCNKFATYHCFKRR